jgi:hypothetical protein
MTGMNEIRRAEPTGPDPTMVHHPRAPVIDFFRRLVARLRRR